MKRIPLDQDPRMDALEDILRGLPDDRAVKLMDKLNTIEEGGNEDAAENT